MKLYGGQPREQFIWTADKQQCSATVLCKVAVALSILFNLCLQFPELSLCQHHCTFDRWSPACEASSLSLAETLHLTVFFFLLLPHRYAAQWLAVAVAPIMNSLLHLNTEYFHYISFIGIMRAEGKLTAGLCNSMASTALFSTGLCLGACLSVWSSCVGLDTGVQSQMVASSNGVSTPGWCLHQLCLLLVKALMYRAATPRNVEALPRTVSPWLQSVSLLWQCWPQKPMHANRLKMTEVHFEAIMSCWSPTQRSRSKTKSNLRHRRASWPCKSESNPLNTLYGGH